MMSRLYCKKKQPTNQNHNKITPHQTNHKPKTKSKRARLLQKGKAWIKLRSLSFPASSFWFLPLLSCCLCCSWTPLLVACWDLSHSPFGATTSVTEEADAFWSLGCHVSSSLHLKAEAHSARPKRGGPLRILYLNGTLSAPSASIFSESFWTKCSTGDT